MQELALLDELLHPAEAAELGWSRFLCWGASSHRDQHGYGRSSRACFRRQLPAPRGRFAMLAPERCRSDRSTLSDSCRLGPEVQLQNPLARLEETLHSRLQGMVKWVL